MGPLTPVFRRFLSVTQDTCAVLGAWETQINPSLCHCESVDRAVNKHSHRRNHREAPFWGLPLAHQESLYIQTVFECLFSLLFNMGKALVGLVRAFSIIINCEDFAEIHLQLYLVPIVLQSATYYSSFSPAQTAYSLF